MLRKAKTITEIFSEVKNFDLVITSDAPLATALNKLVEEPRLDYLAMTPKQIASKFAQLYFDKVYEKYEVVLEITKKTGKSLKFVHQSLEKIYEVWMYNAKFEYTEMFLNPSELEIAKLLPEYSTIETAMENFNEEFFGNKKIAIAGEELFSLLDLEVLPRKGAPAAKIEIFKEEGYRIEQTHIFNSSGNLIDNVIGLINEDNADETAIVLNTDSNYLEIIKSRLKESGISIEVKNYLSDDSSVRSFISLIELSLRIDELKVSEFIPLALEIGVEVSPEFLNYDLSSYVGEKNERSNLARLYEFCKQVSSYKYFEIINELKKVFQFKLSDDFTEALSLIGFKDKMISETNLIELKYFLREFDIEVSSEKSGVLFVNALHSAFIDRQIIIYIGLDNSWMKMFPDKDYLNKEEEERKNLDRFQMLIQQGDKRFYFVMDSVDNIEVPPCYYFLMLGENEARSFQSKYFNPVKVISEKTEKPFPKKKTQFPAEENIVKTISPSAFNKYFKCPKFYSINRFIDSEDTYVFKKGNLLHDFAELYFQHPDFVKENIEDIIDKMIYDISLFHKYSNTDYIRSEFTLGTEAIVTFLDNRKFHKTELEKPEDAKENQLMKDFSLKKIYNFTEQRLPNSELTGITGKIDLQSGNTIIDYKSGKHSRSNLNKAMQSNIGYINYNESEEFDFQTIAYIAALRRSFQEINFIYYFIYNDIRKRINPNDFDNNSNEVEVRYYPMTFIEYVKSIEVFEKFDKDKSPGKFLSKLGYEYYKILIDNLNLEASDYFNDELLTNRFLEEANQLFTKLGYTYRTVRAQKQESFNTNYIEPIAAKLFEIRTGKVNPPIIFKDDVDEFTELIKTKLVEIDKFENSVYEYSPAFGSREICKNCEFLNICIGNKLWN